MRVSSRKKCLSCNKRRSVNAFRLRGDKPRGTCRECENSQNRKRGLSLRAKVLDYLRSHPCIDCGEDDPVVLEFDHIKKKGKKKSGVAELVKKGYSWEVVEAEITKCEVRCANCHRLKTAKENNYWIYRQEYKRKK